MDIHQLRDFAAVATAGSFSQAALESGVAQPSLSKTVQRLEAEVGEQLFIRLKRKSVLTPAGEIALKRVVRILKEVEELKRELGDVRGLRGGTVKLGVLPTIGPYFLPGIVSRFSESFPALQVSIVEDNTVNLLGMIESCELDLAVMSLPLSVEGIEKEHLFKEELLLALPSKHPLAAKEKVSVADLEKEKLILMKEEAQSLRDQLQASSNQCGVPPNVVLRSSQIETIEAHIVAGLGLSLLPKAAKLNAKNGIVYRSLEEPKPTRTNVVVWRKGRQHTKAAGEFLKHLRRALQETRDANPD